MSMCWNWKVVCGLSAVGVGIYLVAPGLLLGPLPLLPLLLLAVCPLSMLLFFMSDAGGKQHNTKQSAVAGATWSTSYTCPMHADMRSDQAGRCPRCGMALVPAGPAQAALVARLAALQQTEADPPGEASEEARRPPAPPAHRTQGGNG